MNTLLMRRTLRSMGIVATAGILSISSTLVPLLRGVANAGDDPGVAVGSTVSSQEGVAVAVPDITVTGSGTLTANVYVVRGSFTLPDPSSGVTYENSVSSGTNVTMSGTSDDINAALSGLMYTSSTPGTIPIYVSVMPSASGTFDPLTKHVFEYNATTRTESAAATFAATQNLDGATGYVATPTTSDENDILTSLNDSGWLGGGYDRDADAYTWQDGPLTGDNIGDSGQFTNWANNEPDENNGVAQDCTVIQDLDGDQIGDYWTANQCSPGVAFRFGTYIEFDVSADVEQAQQQVTIATPTHDIANCTQLQAMDSDPTTYLDTFDLTADIDCQNIPFTPLDWSGNPFGGTFNGQGHSISGLNITAIAPQNNAGLFTYTSGATLENVTLASGTGIHAQTDGEGGSGYAGALAGEADDSTITNVVSHLNVTSDTNEAGGLVGDVESDTTGSTITDSSSTGDVSGGYCVGGLLGYADGGGADLIIEHDYSTGTVTASSDDVGGLIGDLEAGDDNAGSTVTVQNAYSWSNISAEDSESVGGLIGEIDTYSSGSTIDVSNAYASGTIIADDYVGGLIGTANYSGDSAATTLTNVFSEAGINVTDGDPSYVGYIIGDNENWDSGGATIGSGIYYDSTSSGITSVSFVDCASTSDASLSGCTDVNADGTHDSYFINNHANAPMNAWNFTNIWVANANLLPTFSPVTADDNDGVSSGIEDASPNNGDGNNDGTVDSNQANVTSFVDNASGDYVTVAAPGSCSLSAVTAVAETANAKQDGAYSYPDGMVNYTAACGTDGYTATMHLYFYGQTNLNQVLRKYDATTQTYVNVPGTSLISTTIGGQTAIEATYNIKDGGPLDADGTANGTIVDPIGLALASSQSASSTSASGLTDTGIDLTAITGIAALLIVASVAVAKRRSGSRKSGRTETS